MLTVVTDVPSAVGSSGKPRRPATAALAATLGESVNRFNRRMRRERPHNDLTLSQTSALAVLERQGAKTPGELASCERVKPPSMTRIIAVLEAKGLVERQAHPSDKRQVIVQATVAGKALIKENRRAREAWLAQRLAELTPHQRELLASAAEILDDLAGK